MAAATSDGLFSSSAGGGNMSEQLSFLSQIWQDKKPAPTQGGPQGGPALESLLEPVGQRSQSAGVGHPGGHGLDRSPSAAASLALPVQDGSLMHAPSTGLGRPGGPLSASDAILNAKLANAAGTDGAGGGRLLPQQSSLMRPDWSVPGGGSFDGLTKRGTTPPPHPGTFGGQQGAQNMLLQQQQQRLASYNLPRVSTPAGQGNMMQGQPGGTQPGNGTGPALGTSMHNSFGSCMPQQPGQVDTRNWNRTSAPMTPNYATLAAAQAAQAAATNAALAIARQQQQTQHQPTGNSTYWQGANVSAGHQMGSLPLQQQQLAGSSLQGQLGGGLNDSGRFPSQAPHVLSGQQQQLPLHLQLGGTLPQGLSGSLSNPAANLQGSGYQSGAVGGGASYNPSMGSQQAGLRRPDAQNAPNQHAVAAAAQAAAQAALLKRSASLPAPLQGLLLRNGQMGGPQGGPGLGQPLPGGFDIQDIDLSGLTPAQLQMLISSPAEQVWRLAAQMGVIKRNSPQGAQQGGGGGNASQANYINAMAHLHQLHGHNQAPKPGLGGPELNRGGFSLDGLAAQGVANSLGQGPSPVPGVGNGMVTSASGSYGLGQQQQPGPQLGVNNLNVLSAAAQQRTLQQIQRQQLQQQQQAQLQKLNLQQLLQRQQQQQAVAQQMTAQEGSAERILSELGKTLARMGISVDAAVNAGLLGGLSVPDLTTLLSSHAGETQRMQAAGVQPQPQMAAQLFGPSGAAQLQSSNAALQGGSTSLAGSMGGGNMQVPLHSQQQQGQGQQLAGHLGAQLQAMSLGQQQVLPEQQGGPQVGQLQQQRQAQAPPQMGGLSASLQGQQGLAPHCQGLPQDTGLGTRDTLDRVASSPDVGRPGSMAHSFEAASVVQRPKTVHPPHAHSVDSLEGHRLSAEAEDLLHQMKASGQLPPDFQQRSASAFPTKDLAADPGSVAGSLGAQSRASPQGDGERVLLGRAMRQQGAAQADGYDFFGNMDSSTDHVLEVESAHSGSTPKAGAAEVRKSEPGISMAGPVAAARKGAGMDQGPGQPAARPVQSNTTTPTAATATAASGHEEDAGVPTDEEIIMQHLSGLDLGPGF